MIAYPKSSLGHPKSSVKTTKNLIEQISEFSKVLRYKISLQKTIVFLYTSDKHMEYKVKNIAPITIIQKKLNTSV
jgi:hypothetical protein